MASKGSYYFNNCTYDYSFYIRDDFIILSLTNSFTTQEKNDFTLFLGNFVIIVVKCTFCKKKYQRDCLAGAEKRIQITDSILP